MFTKNKQRCLTPLLLIIIFFISLSTYAKHSTNYQIELIIFKHNNTAADIYKENWPNAKLAIPNNNIKLSTDNQFDTINSSNQNSPTYPVLSKDQLRFTNLYNKIRYSKRYTAITHIGWIQPKKEITKPIYFTAGQTYYQNNTNLQELSGVIKFSVKKYVHTKMDLLLNLPVKPSNIAGKQFELVQNLNNDSSNDVFLQGFLLSEDRRLKNNELNYFDHPAFSAVLVVSEV